MAKPVDKLSFWAQRLKEAREQGKDIRYAVFQTNPRNWIDIDDAHSKIIQEVISLRDTVLDAGCGFGRATQFFLPGQYLGIDQSPELIEEAKQFYPNYSFFEGNLNQLTFEDNSFDWALCISIKIMIINNLGYDAWGKIQKELLRVTRKGILCLEYGDVGQPFTAYSICRNL